MKKNRIKLLSILLFGLTILGACKKDDTQAGANVSIESKEYSFNIATKEFTPDNTITANVKSDVGVESVYAYLIRGNKPDSLIRIFLPGEGDNINDLNLNIEASVFAKADMSAAEGIKMVVKSLNNAGHVALVKINPFAPDMPHLSEFPVSKEPDANEKILIEGKASSENGIVKIEILDDSTGPFTVVHTIDNLNNIKNYEVNYTYTYRPEAGNVQIILYDGSGLTVAHTMKIATVPYVLRTDVWMDAQGASNNNTVANWVHDMTWTVMGSCDLHDLVKNSTDPLKDHQRIAFLFYGTSTNATFYSASSATSISKNFYCGTNQWGVPTTDISAMKATKFRAILRSDNAATAAFYANIESGNITSLDDEAFTGIKAPSSSQAKYVENPADGGANEFNATTRNLIWAQVPKENGGIVNVILRVKEVNYSTAAPKEATIKFDMYVQK